MTDRLRLNSLRTATAFLLSILIAGSPSLARDTEDPEFEYDPPPPTNSTGNDPIIPLGLASQHRCAWGVANQIDKMQQWSGGTPMAGNPYAIRQNAQLLPGSFNHALGVLPVGKIYNWRYTKTRENTGPVKFEPLGVNLGTIWVDGGNNHFQSIARYSHQQWGRFFVWSGADWHAGAEGGAHLFFAHMESRSNDPNAAMTSWESNLVPDAHYGWPMPTFLDKVFYRMDLDNSTMHPDGSVTYWHAGGIQAYNNLIAVALENGDMNVGTGEGHNKGKIVFVSAENLWEPVRLSSTSEIFSTEGKIGAVALTQNRDGHWIVAAWRDRKIWLYISRLKGGPRAVEGGWKPLGIWAEPGGYNQARLPAPGSIDDSAGYYQNINFINGCDGTFYLAGMNNANLGGTGAFGEDWLDLYALIPTGEGIPNRYYFNKIWKKHFVMDSDHASFMMASGMYVSPNGKIMMYAGGGYQQTRMNGAKWLSFREFVAP